MDEAAEVVCVREGEAPGYTVIVFTSRKGTEAMPKPFGINPSHIGIETRSDRITPAEIATTVIISVEDWRAMRLYCSRNRISMRRYLGIHLQPILDKIRNSP